MNYMNSKKPIPASRHLTSELSRYIARRVTFIALALLVTMFSVIWLTQSLRFIDWMVNRGLPFSVFIYMAILISPNFMIVLLPITLFIAVLFAYNRLVRDSELVVMQAAGYSPLSLMSPALMVGVIFTLVGYILTIWIMPLAYHTYKEKVFQMRNTYSGVLLQEGVFTVLDNGVTVFVRKRDENGQLQDIVLSDESVFNKSVIITAQTGTLVETDSGPQFQLKKGNRQEWSYDSNKVGFLYFDDYTVDIKRLKEIRELRTPVATERYIHDLFNPKDVTDLGLIALFRIEAHRRITEPLMILALVSVALVTMLLDGNARQGQSLRIIVAITIAATFELLQIFWGQLGVNFPIFRIFMYLMPIAIFATCLFIASPYGERIRSKLVNHKTRIAE